MDAGVAELAYALASEASARQGFVGSSPTARAKKGDQPHGYSEIWQGSLSSSMRGWSGLLVAFVAAGVEVTLSCAATGQDNGSPRNPFRIGEVLTRFSLP